MSSATLCSRPSRVQLRLKLRLFFLLPTSFFLAACSSFPVLGPTPTPSATFTPAATATPTPTPTPTPAPTPVPAARIGLADQALFEGDWETAIREYQAAYTASTDEGVRASALLGMGKTRLAAGDAPEAISSLTALEQRYPNSPLAPDGYFLLGEAQRLAQTWGPAIQDYQIYLKLRPGTLDSYVQERIGQAAFTNQDDHLAAQAYLAAIAAPRADQSQVLDLRERLSEVDLALGDTAAALDQYDAIYAAATEDWRKAHADMLAGQLLYNTGHRDEAYKKFQDAVTNYPDSAESFQALLTLVNDGVPVDDLARGLANYYAKNYQPALAAFERYQASNPQADGTALYYEGLTLSALGRDADAIAMLMKLAKNYPNNAHWADAYFQVAFIQPYPQDSQTFQNFVAAAPASLRAPDALYRAARQCERNDNLLNAAALWTRIATEYPTADTAADSAIQAGIALYRHGSPDPALQRFQLATTLGTDPAEHARAWLWVGKAKAKGGDKAGAQQAWTQASNMDPHAYYSLRAAQLLRNEAPFTPLPGYSWNFDAAAERAETEAWLRANFSQLPATGDLGAISADLLQDGRFARGAELWRLGLLREAHTEFDALRQGLTADPLAEWQLALYFHDLGAYDLSIRAAARVVDLAGYTDLLAAPRFILRLRYPAPFADRVTAAAESNGLHPFLMLAKMRLESFFWKYAYSSAQARGLNQIIPDTATDIAGRMGLKGFTQDDLFRPAVSIPMGAFYLHYVGGVTSADPQAMLAGYYAGPANAQIWQQISAGDPDLFLEVMRLPDARMYVETAAQYFMEYNDLYGVK